MIVHRYFELSKFLITSYLLSLISMFFYRLKIQPTIAIGVIGGAMNIIGLFEPWLSQSTNGLGEHYRFTIKISPLFVSIAECGSSKSILWFYNISISIAAIGLIVAGIICSLSFGNWKISLTGWCIWVISFMLFFLSLGRGLSLGIRTFVCGGFWITLSGGILMFISTLIDMS